MHKFLSSKCLHVSFKMQICLARKWFISILCLEENSNKTIFNLPSFSKCEILETTNKHTSDEYHQFLFYFIYCNFYEKQIYIIHRTTLSKKCFENYFIWNSNSISSAISTFLIMYARKCFGFLVKYLQP